MPKSTTVAALAKELDMTSSALRKGVLKMGIHPHRVRTLESRGQAMLALMPEDAKRVREYYKWRLENA